MPTINLRRKKVLVMGLGLIGGGVATVKFLYSQGAKITVTDLKSNKELAPALNLLTGKKISYILGKHRDKDILSHDLIIQNPGVPKGSPYLALAKEHRIPIENDASLFFRYCRYPVIGVTGTKGKSTTVDLIRKILEEAGQKPLLVGHNTTPVLSQLKHLGHEKPILFELSSWRLERLPMVKKSPHISVITNLFNDHLNKYRNFNEYVEDKKNIFRYQNKHDYAVLNLDNCEVKKISSEVASQIFWFCQKYFPEQNGTFIKGKTILFRKNGRESAITTFDKCDFVGRILLENALPAITVAKILRIKNVDIVAALNKYQPLKGRCEKLATIQGVTFINDTTATIPEATIAALNKFSQKVILIAGGEDKNLDYAQLIKILPTKVKSIHLIKGSATNKILRFIKHEELPYTVSINLQGAFKQAIKRTAPGDIIILSPAAASFGKYFINEFDRGQQFEELVANFKKQL